MIHAIVRKNDLAKFFSTLDVASLDRALAPEPTRETVIVVYGDDPTSGTLPRKIIVPDDEMDAFFAWAATYLDVLSPISAFIDVVSASESAKSVYEFGGRKNRERGDAALLAIASIEGMIQATRGRARGPRPLVGATLRSLSWSVAQAILKRLPPDDVAAVIDRWTRIRSGLISADMPYSVRNVGAFWKHVLPAFGYGVSEGANTALLRLNVDLLAGNEPRFDLWNGLTQELVDAGNIEAVMRGPRQRRIEVLEQATRNLGTDDRADAEVLSAFCGFVGSRVADGSLEVWNAVLDRSANHATMPLWFAFYCGATRGASVMDFERSTPRRLLHMLDDPAYDVDAREMLVLMRAGTAAVTEITPASPGTLRVRLAPGVVGSFLSRDAGIEERGRETPAADEARASTPSPDQRQVAALVADARTAVERANVALQRIQGILPPPQFQQTRPTQPELQMPSSSAPAYRKQSRRRDKS